MNLSIKHKIFSLFMVVIVLVVSAVGWFGFKSAKDSYISSALSINEGKTELLSNEINGVLRTLSEDLIYNADFYALEKLLVWEDLKDRRKIRDWKNVYISALKDYILSRKLYYQVRILDTEGNEKILIQYDEKTNIISETPNDKLQNKSHRKYFKEAMKLKKGEFYISDMSLNVENGMIEKPFIPVVRYATPLINENREIKGVLILNFNASYILNEIADAKKENQALHNFYLLNEDGYYLFTEDKTKRWGFQLGTGYNFNKDYKGVMEKFKNKDKVTFIDNGKLFSMYKIYPHKFKNSYRFWYFVSEIDESVAFSSLNIFMNQFFFILLFVLLSGLFVINWYISKLMRPLGKVTSQLKSLSNGEIQKESIDYTANDEIGDIVNSTAKLVDAIATTIKQANAVANGSFTQKIELLSKNDELGLALESMTLRLNEITNLAQSLSMGNYDVKVIARNSEDKLGLALIDMVRYLESITKITESISLGELNVKYKVKGAEDRLGYAVLQMIKYLKTILKQANAISQENFTTTINVKSKNDELGQALVTMTNILKNSSIQNKNEIYFSEGIGKFSDELTGETDTIELSRKAITMVSRYVGASSGVLYTFNKEQGELKLIASFAYTSRNSLSNSFKLGEGIIGQVALEKDAILIRNIKDDEFIVQSGTTSSTPKEVYAFPLVYEGELFGVMELMSYEHFTSANKEYLLKISSIFASALHTTNQNTQIKVLLEKSQSAYEELQVQSEELQESNVQMEEQQQQLTLQSKELEIKNNTLLTAKEEINERAKDLEKASKYKSEFLANMSHELRTPLNSIILLSKLLVQNKNSTLNSKDIEKSKVIHKAGNDLLFLINDILDLSKVESGNMELDTSEVSTSEIIDELQGLFGAIADEKALAFIIEDRFNASLLIDKSKFLQVLKNLLSNAFKFTKKGSVTLIIESTSNEIIFKVKDSGIGIPSDKLETVFEAFKQVDGTISREFGGTGLGLSISRTIIDLMGGTIELESEFGVGTTFIVNVPFDRDKQKIDKILSEEKKIVQQKKLEEKIDEKIVEVNKFSIINDEDDNFSQDILTAKNILIVDDDSRNIFTLTSTLEEMGAEVFSAFNGKEAIEMLEDDENSMDIVLMDIMMPVMDGLDAIERIKADDRFKNIPIIAITAKNMPEDKQRCLDAGANDYLAKPLKYSALVNIFKAWLK